jgi:pimeloyl-ACP methyl ester carboxylesterase
MITGMNTLLIIFACLALLLILFPIVLHWVYRAPRLVEQITPESINLAYTQHQIPTMKQKLLYSWLIEHSSSNAIVIFVHGWGANAQMMLPLAVPFFQAGMEVLLYDARNHGKSDGDTFSSLPRFAEDLEAVIEWVSEHRNKRSIIVIGHSLGAAAAMLAASRNTRIDLVISVSGFAHPKLVMQRHLDRAWLPQFLRPVIINYVQWVIGYQFDEIAPMNRVRDIHCPVLLAHGTDDRVVPISDMHLIKTNAGPDNEISLLPIHGAKHNSVQQFQEHADLLINYIDTKLSFSQHLSRT